MQRFLCSALLVILVVVTGCSADAGILTSASGVPANAIKITLAYSPEKEGWLTDRFAAFAASKPKLNGRPIVVEGINKSSGAARTEMVQGTFKPTVWSPSSSAWLEVLKNEAPNTPDPAVSNKALVLTPVVISMWKPMAEALGWPTKPIGWSDLLALTKSDKGWGEYNHPEWGRFTWGHTDPEISTTALSTILAEVYSANNKARGLTVADVQGPQTTQFLSDLSHSIRHYGYNTLVFSDNMKKYGMSYISAFPMEEITLIDFNKGQPNPPLVAIYPREGTFFHDDPFIVMRNAPVEEQQAAAQLYDFLLTPASQTVAMSYGFRPANPNVKLASPLTPAFGIDPAQPQTTLEVPSGAVLVAAKQAWGQARKRADIVLLLDISGSMNGDKLDQAKNGVGLFLSRLLPDDRVALVTFSDKVTQVQPLAKLRDNRLQLDGAITDIQANGGTALYDGLQTALQTLKDVPDAQDRIQAVVLLSDGADNSSKTNLYQIKQQFVETNTTIFPIAYGSDANETVLKAIADFGRGEVIKGGTSDINKVFENLSRYF
ncbi:MAG: VWA domain-containing protein [Herpetosiphonaceae bacterium]|nr:VWA domain-containing protein [Herpetosiphonaceae bacterium]